MNAKCHPDRLHLAKGLCRACYLRAWYWKNPERRRAYAQKAYHKHTSRLRVQRQAARLRYKAACFAHYGLACACCGENELRFLTLDHIRNDGAAFRKVHGRFVCGSNFYNWLRERDYPQDLGLQVLCFNCNVAKRSGPCPHKDREKEGP